MSEQEFNAKQNAVPNTPETSGLTDDTAETGQTTFDVTEDAEEALRRFQAEQDRQAAEQPPPIIDSDEVMLRLEISESATPLLLSLSDKALIGRRDPAIQAVPEVDMTPYGGYQMGISRRHAIMNVRGGRLELMDLGSRNGTYVGGKRLTPHQPQVLRDGDEIRLGKIVLHVYFQ